MIFQRNCLFMNSYYHEYLNKFIYMLVLHRYLNSMKKIRSSVQIDKTQCILCCYNIYWLCKQSKFPKYNFPRSLSAITRLIGYSPGNVYLRRWNPFMKINFYYFINKQSFNPSLIKQNMNNRLNYHSTKLE